MRKLKRAGHIYVTGHTATDIDAQLAPTTLVIVRRAIWAFDVLNLYKKMLSIFYYKLKKNTLINKNCQLYVCIC